MNLYVLFWLILSLIIYGTGEYFSKIFANTNNTKFAIIASILYFLNAACFLPAIKELNSLAVLGTIWTLGYTLTTLIVGIMIFNEPIAVKQWVAIVLAMVAIALLIH